MKEYGTCPQHSSVTAIGDKRILRQYRKEIEECPNCQIPVPNETTKNVMRKAERGEELEKFDSIDDLVDSIVESNLDE